MVSLMWAVMSVVTNRVVIDLRRIAREWHVDDEDEVGIIPAADRQSTRDTWKRRKDLMEMDVRRARYGVWYPK